MKDKRLFSTLCDNQCLSFVGVLLGKALRIMFLDNYPYSSSFHTETRRADKRVLLTGGTGGLGLGVTPAVLHHGGHLTMTYREEREVGRLKSRLSAAEFERIRFVKVDLTQETAVARLIDDLGRVDVLIRPLVKTKNCC